MGSRERAALQSPKWFLLASLLGEEMMAVDKLAGTIFSPPRGEDRRVIIRKGNENHVQRRGSVEEVITRLLFFKMLLSRYDSFSKILNHPLFQNYLLLFFLLLNLVIMLWNFYF